MTDNGNKNIRKIMPTGVVKTLRDAGNGTLLVNPISVATDDKGQIYVADEDGFNIIIGKRAQ